MQITHDLHASMLEHLKRDLQCLFATLTTGLQQGICGT